MSALHSRCGHYIFILWFLLSSSLFFFFSAPDLRGLRLDVYCLPYFHTWCGLSVVNLECRSETCCALPAENTGCKKSPSGHHPTTLSGYIFATKACIDNRKKNLLSTNISSPSPHNMVNFGPLVAEIVSLVWGTPANFNGTLVVGISQTAAFNKGRHLYSAGGHHVGHWPTFLGFFSLMA